MNRFIFESYGFDKDKSLALFNYRFKDGQAFTEKVSFTTNRDYDEKTLDKALFLAFLLIGTSYYKTFPTKEVQLDYPIDEWQAGFFDRVYQEGLGQFAYENGLKRDNLAHFAPNNPVTEKPLLYHGSGILALQSGGKDSLLTASILGDKNIDFDSWYVSSGLYYPKFISNIGSKSIISRRAIDVDALRSSAEKGAKNGHVPITYILQSLAVVQAILIDKNIIITSIAHEGEEPHSRIGDMEVNHQWSKTWAAERDFADYVHRYISPNIKVGSLLRKYSELKVAKLFVEHAWEKYKDKFSSCNIANYRQAIDNSELSWCGDCPKCANSYLLFAPFLPSKELNSIFGGKDLLANANLEDTFKGLLGVDSVAKPFECVGEIRELRLAYHMALEKRDYTKLSFNVPKSSFDYQKLYESQDWASEMLQ